MKQIFSLTQSVNSKFEYNSHRE